MDEILNQARARNIPLRVHLTPTLRGYIILEADVYEARWLWRSRFFKRLLAGSLSPEEVWRIIGKERGGGKFRFKTNRRVLAIAGFFRGWKGRTHEVRGDRFLVQFDKMDFPVEVYRDCLVTSI